MKQFIPLVDLPENYEAYLYLVVFQHNKLMKYYLGWHKGLFDGTYKGSPKAHEEEFMKDLGKYDYEIYAIAVGKAKKMIFMEKIMLNNLKKNNPQPKDYPILPSSDWKEFYNESTGGGTELQNCSTGVEDIQNAVDTEDWNTLRRIKVDKKEVHSWTPYQVRPQWLMPSHVADIKVELKDTDGKWLDAVNEKTGKPNFKGVLTFEDYYGKGKHLRIGSAHTTEASQTIGQIEDLWVIFVPKKMWKDLKKTDIKELGQWDNPQVDMPFISTPEEEHIDWIVESCIEKNITPDHFSFEHKLKKQKRSHQKIRGLKSKARGRLGDKKAFAKTGLKQVNWDKAAEFIRKNEKLIAEKRYPKVPVEGTREYELTKKIEAFNGDCIIGSAGNENKIVIDMTELLRQNLIVEGGSKEKNYMIFVKNTVKDGAKSVKENWDKSDKPHLYSTIDLWKKMYLDEEGDPTLNIEIEDLEFTEPDPTFETLN